MHLHEKPKGSGEKTSTAGQPCKIGECNQSNSSAVAKRCPSILAPASVGIAVETTVSRHPRDFSAVASDTQGLAPSFRGDAKHRTRNLFHRRACGSMDSGLAPRGAPRNDGEWKQIAAIAVTLWLRMERRRCYRFTLACSAELCAASASWAEICAVCAAVPQLGASLPSPQARGR